MKKKPTDEDLLVDGMWLRKSGFIRPMAPAGEHVFVIGDWQAVEGRGGLYPISLHATDRIGNEWAMYIGGYLAVRSGATQGQVRCACQAFGIKLQLAE